MSITVTTPPQCPAGHGELAPHDGIWSLPGWSPDAARPGHYARNGLSLLVRVWVCPHCTTFRLTDFPLESADAAVAAAAPITSSLNAKESACSR